MLKTTLTLGPATFTTATLEGIFPAADRFRLNAAHLQPESLLLWLEKLDALFRKTGRTIPVTLDLQGAKMRIGKIPPATGLAESVTLLFTHKTSETGIIPVPHELFFSEIQKGDRITLNDARVELEILDHSSEMAHAKVLRSGPLSSDKGINRSQHPIPYKKISELDTHMIRLTAGADFVDYAFSFVNTGDEAKLIRPLIGRRKLIAKLERPEALQNLQVIDAAFDELWLCRGDLGAQAGLRKMAALQTDFEKRIPKLKKPAWLAGQVLEYMTHPQPTRSEVVQLARAEEAGYDGIVLSDETAVGKNPLELCRFLQQWRAKEI